MNTLTLQAARSTVARALKKCATESDGTTNPEVRDLLNEAQLRLLNRPGTPVGAMQRYRFTPTASEIVLPRQVRTVIKGVWCDYPARVFPEWYTMDLNGPGELETTSFVGEAIIDRGTACAFADITSGATDRTLRVTTDVAEDAGTYLWLYGYDENAQWIRTLINGEWHDGERLDLGTASQDTTHKFSSLVRVHKDETNGIVRVYEWNTTTAAVVRQLAQYEPSETDPIYRKVMLPSVTDYTDSPTVSLLVKLQHVPVVADLDTFVLGNLPALKLMCMAVQAEEEQRYGDSANLQSLAEREIDGELAAYLGAGMRVTIAVDRYTLFGAGGVENLI